MKMEKFQGTNTIEEPKANNASRPLREWRKKKKRDPRFLSKIIRPGYKEYGRFCCL